MELIHLQKQMVLSGISPSGTGTVGPMYFSGNFIKDGGTYPFGISVRTTKNDNFKIYSAFATYKDDYSVLAFTE